MRFFVDQELRTVGSETNPLNPEMSIRKTDEYIEVQYKVKNTTSSLITYVVPHSQGGPWWFAAACLDMMPEFLWNLLYSTKGIKQEAWLREVAKQCPTTIAAFGNAAAGSGDAALVKWNDADTGVDKWFLAVLIQRDFSEFGGYFEFDGKVDAALNGAMSLGARVCREILQFRIDVDSLGENFREALDAKYEKFNRFRESLEIALDVAEIFLGN